MRLLPPPSSPRLGLPPAPVTLKLRRLALAVGIEWRLSAATRRLHMHASVQRRFTCFRRFALDIYDMQGLISCTDRCISANPFLTLDISSTPHGAFQQTGWRSGFVSL